MQDLLGQFSVPPYTVDRCACVMIDIGCNCLVQVPLLWIHLGANILQTFCDDLLPYWFRLLESIQQCRSDETDTDIYSGAYLLMMRRLSFRSADLVMTVWRSFYGTYLRKCTPFLGICIRKYTPFLTKRGPFYGLLNKFWCDKNVRNTSVSALSCGLLSLSRIVLSFFDKIGL